MPIQTLIAPHTPERRRERDLKRNVAASSSPKTPILARTLVGGLTMVGGATAWAGAGPLGTKIGGDYALPPAGATGVGFGSLAQMILALAIVAFLLKWVLPKIAGKLTKKLVTTPASGILIEESAQFAGGSLYVITARGKSILVSVAGTTVATLTELDAQAAKPADAFELVLTEAKAKPAPTAAELEARAALDRLTQLTGGHAVR